MSEMALKLIRQAKAEKWKTLDLGNCGIVGELPVELGELVDLEELILSGSWWDLVVKARKSSRNNGSKNKIVALGGPLPPNLANLVAEGLGLGDACGLAPLASLSVLNLQDNKLADISPLAGLRNLATLYLSHNQVADISPVIGLNNLVSLDFTRNKVADIGPLAGLANLASLNLSHNQLADISPLAGLHNLASLNLTENQVADISHLVGLHNLTWLNLSENQVADISPVKGLNNLAWLNLGKNQVADISPVKGLNNLAWLNLGKNKVDEINPLAGLHNLATLSLWGNQVADIGPLAKLQNLATLDLAYNQIAEIGPLANLQKLTTLDLWGNLVADIGPLANLLNLATLTLRGNRVSDIGPLEALANLATLNLSQNQVADISPLKGIIEKKGIKVNHGDRGSRGGIFLEDCPLTNPPVEIVAQGNEAILNYFEEKDKVPLYEAKVLLVGDPNSGKTTLARRMFWEKMVMPKAQERTVGIDIHKAKYTLPNGQEMRLNVWDFAGQEVRHATHQFFFTSSSIYVLLDDTSENHENANDLYFRNWLGWVELLGGDSPIMIFQNEKGGKSRAIDFTGIKQRYDKVEQQLRGDLNCNGSADTMKMALQARAVTLNHIGSLWPKKWIAIREELEKRALAEPLISLQAYLTICADHGEQDETKALSLSQFFHDLGVCLHFQKDETLRQWIVLQNDWATDAVYLILTDEIIKDSGKGRFTQADRDRIWSDSKYKHHQSVLLALMERFDLCYYLKDTEPKQWLVPQMLHPSRPEGLDFSPETGDLVVKYHYRYMPKGLINRLMTRNHRQVRHAGMAWLKGVLFETDEARLLAVHDVGSEEIVLRAKGPKEHKFALMKAVSTELESIHALFPQIRVTKKIPCICKACGKSTDPEMYDFGKLMARKDKPNGGEIKCDRDPFEIVDVRKLLTGFESETAPDGKRGDWMERKMDRLHERFDDIEAGLNAIKEDTGQISEVVDIVEDIQINVEIMLAKLDEIDRKLIAQMGLTERGQLEIAEMLLHLDAMNKNDHSYLQEVLEDLSDSVSVAADRNEALFGEFAAALSTELKEKFQQLSSESFIKGEMKGKWKIAIPFVPGFVKYEMEIGTDYSKAFQKLIDGLGGAKDRTVMRLQEKARKVLERSQKLLGSGK